ncbi:MAG: CoA transferase, partial [Gammaproteobacteria bacterium]
EMERVLSTAPTRHWIQVLEEAGVPCGPVYNYEQLFNDSQVRHRELVVYAADQELGEVPHIRTPIRMPSGVSVRSTAPALGQHNEEVFGELGYDRQRLDAMVNKGVI